MRSAVGRPPACRQIHPSDLVVRSELDTSMSQSGRAHLRNADVAKEAAEARHDPKLRAGAAGQRQHEVRTDVEDHGRVQDD